MTSINSLNGHAKKPEIKPFPTLIHMPREKETKAKKTIHNHPKFRLICQPYTREERQAKDPFTLLQCMQTSHELNPYSPNHQRTGNPEGISTKTRSSPTSKRMPN